MTKARLPSEFTQLHRQVIHRYFRGQETMRRNDWPLLIQAMDLLRRAKIVKGEQRETFTAIYDRLVDAVYANDFIHQLLDFTAPQSEGERLRAAVSRQIMAALRMGKLWQTNVPDSQLLVAFCLYWWQMFAKGYIFEVVIYRDLTTSNVTFAAHDLRNRHARLSGYDLEIMGFHGDIKTSTYFVLTRRSEKLTHDFYITRMYNVSKRRWYQVVWLKPAFWEILNGKPTPVNYDAIWQVLPGVAQITLRKKEFIVAMYDKWKRLVVSQQAQENN